MPKETITSEPIAKPMAAQNINLTCLVYYSLKSSEASFLKDVNWKFPKTKVAFISFLIFTSNIKVFQYQNNYEDVPS